MEALLFHPKLVHVPIALGVLMPLVAGALLLAWWRKWLPPRAWLLAAGLQLVLVVSGTFAIRSGEAEEERVEQVVPEAAIEHHEEAAEAFVWASAGVLMAMLAATALAKRGPGLSLAAAATAGTLVVLGLGYRTGQAGGRLVYEHGAAQAYVGDNPGAQGGPPAASAETERDGERDEDEPWPQ